MSDYQMKPNRGSLFINNKRDKDTSPHYNGSLKVGDAEYWINGWKETSQAGNSYLSLSISLKEQQPEPEAAPAQPAMADAGLDDDIPF